MTWEEAYDSLVSCIIGVISTNDLYNVKKVLEETPNDLIREYYYRAIEDHCNMSIYYNDWVM